MSTGAPERFTSDRFNARLGTAISGGSVSVRLDGKPFVDADLRSKHLDFSGLLGGAAERPTRQPRGPRPR